jgi:dimethylglycine dehydrogenase
VHGVTDADALGNNPIYEDGALVGRATGGNYGFRVEKSLALARVRPEHAEFAAELEMVILGSHHRVTGSPRAPTTRRTCA